MSEYSARIYRLIFFAAAAYNIAFGLWAALMPLAFFELFHLASPRYPAIWACLGMVIGLYGVGYAYAAYRLDRAFPFIAIGLAGKVLGPIGWIMAVRAGELPFRTFRLIVFDDLFWWTPFALFLLEGTTIANFIKRTAAYWCAAMHAVAAAGTLVLLRGGSEAVPVEERIAYLNQFPDRWRIGWLLWMVAAISLVGFYVWWGRKIATRTALRAFIVAAIGMVCDFSGESIFIGWVPQPGESLSRIASLLTGGAANGLYTVAGIMLMIASTLLLPPALKAWGWAAWISGIALTIFTIADLGIGVVVASGALIILFTPWVLAVGLKLR